MAPGPARVSGLRARAADLLRGQRLMRGLFMAFGICMFLLMVSVKQTYDSEFGWGQDGFDEGYWSDDCSGDSNARKELCNSEIERLNALKKEVEAGEGGSPWAQTLRSHRALLQMWIDFAGNSGKKVDKLAVIVPYRGDEDRARRFLERLLPSLDKQPMKYTVFFFEQTGTTYFNYGGLFNTALHNLLNSDYAYYVFHEMDIVPVKDAPCLIKALPEKVFHVTPGGIHPREGADKYFGGVVVVSRETLIRVNGFPTDGWGLPYHWPLFKQKLDVHGLWPAERPKLDSSKYTGPYYETFDGYPTPVRRPEGPLKGVDRVKGLGETRYWLSNLQPFIMGSIRYSVQLLCDDDRTPWCRPAGAARDEEKDQQKQQKQPGPGRR
eukprot:tig00000219_g19489.t1